MEKMSKGRETLGGLVLLQKEHGGVGQLVTTITIQPPSLPFAVTSIYVKAISCFCPSPMIVSELPLLLQHLGPFAYLLLPSPLMLFHLSPAFDSTIHLTSRYWPSILPHRKQVDTSFLPPQILFYPPGSSSSLFFAPVSDGLSVVFCILLIS